MTTKKNLTEISAPYLAGFRGFFLATGLCGAGGVRSILRSTSSRLDCGFGVFALHG